MKERHPTGDQAENDGDEEVRDEEAGDEEVGDEDMPETTWDKFYRLKKSFLYF